LAYVVDSDYLISAIVGRPDAVALLARLQPAGVSVTWGTVGEVYEGAFGSPDPAIHLAAARRFLAPYPVLAADDAVMERFAEIRALLRRRGQMIPDFDVVLAATAVHYGLTVVSRDRHFNRVPGLTIYQPT
jgi:tRNA(fMet)-specific endonuclease VapC